jgi:hypothetical protein
VAKHTKLIEQLEAAETRDECVTAFVSIRSQKIIHSIQFADWVSKAALVNQSRIFGYPDRTLSYLLLAAIEMVPEGWALRLDRYLMSDKPHPKTWRVWLRRLEGFIEDENAPIGINMKFGSGHHPCTALTAACLRAMDEEVFDINLGNKQG